MKASQLLTVAVEGNSAVISTHKSDSNVSMTFVGASCLVSISPVAHGIQQLQISVDAGEKAIVALRVASMRLIHGDRGWNNNVVDCQFLIPILWEGEKLIVDLDELFVPSGDRLLQLDSHLDLSITTSGQTFTTCRDVWSDGHGGLYAEKQRESVASGKRIVDDPNLLLRFAVGRATLEDLEAAATLDKREQMDRDFAKCRACVREQAGEIMATKTALREYQTRFQEVSAAYARRGIALHECNECKKKQEAVVIQLRDGLEVIKDILRTATIYRTRFGFFPWVIVKKLKRKLGIKS